jgi:hypothetical protein
MTYPRELSQLASFVEVNDSLETVGFTTNINVDGTVEADYFYGDGRFLTNLSSTVTAAGADKQIQFNDNSGVSGASSFYYDKLSNNVGIAISSPTSKLHVQGNVFISGVTTSTTGSFTNVNSLVGSFSTITSTVGIVTSLRGSNLNYTGVSTISNLRVDDNLLVTSDGIFQQTLYATEGPIVVGSDVPVNDAKLQVFGDSYVSGNFGIGVALPTSKLSISGDASISGIITASTFSGYLDGNASTSSVSQTANSLDGPASITNLTVSGITSFQNNTDSTAPNNGSVVLSGGMGIQRNLHIQGDAYFNSSLYLNGQPIRSVLSAYSIIFGI